MLAGTVLLLTPPLWAQRNTRLPEAEDVVFNIHVTAPANAADFDVTEAGLTATPEIGFTGEVRPARVGATINWRPNLEYATSGNRGAATRTRTFQSTSGQISNQVYASEGGRVTVNAEAIVADSTATVTQPPRITVTGVPIPDATITNQLVSLYSGATPRILTGIAMVESTYFQFTNRILFGRADRWPVESFDGGSHIGLMQVAVALAPAWNWLTNTGQGADIFAEGLRISRQRELNDRATHPQLPALTESQHEDNALCSYRLGGPPSNRFWIPSADGLSWAVNATNTVCVDYRNDVRASIR